MYFKLIEKNPLLSLLSDDAGVTAIEYGLIAALIAVAIVTAVSGVGTSLTVIFTKIANDIARS